MLLLLPNILATRSVLVKSDELELEEEAEESSLLLLGASVDKIIVSTIGLEEKNERSWMVPLNLESDEPEPDAAGGALGAAPVAPTVPVTVALGGATVVAAATELLPATEPPKLPLLGGTDLTVWPLAA